MTTNQPKPKWADLFGADPNYAQGPMQERWTRDGRTAVIHYDVQGIAEITREALHRLLADAGFTLVDQT